MYLLMLQIKRIFFFFFVRVSECVCECGLCMCARVSGEGKYMKGRRDFFEKVHSEQFQCTLSMKFTSSNVIGVFNNSKKSTSLSRRW